MKRIVLTLGIVGWFTGVIAQGDLELRRSDMSYPGATFNYQVDTSVNLPNDFSQAGKDLRWDFSQLDNNESFVTKYLAPNSNNGGDQISGCNLVIQPNDQNEEYSYVDANSMDVKLLGNTDDTVSAGPEFKPRYLVFPLKYGDAWSDSNRTKDTYPGSDFGAPFDSLRVDVYVQLNYSCDGQGMLILPIDSVQALRIKQELFYEYNVSGYQQGLGWFPIQNGSDGSISYTFYNAEGGHYAAAIEMNPDQNNVGEISYRSSNILSVRRPAEMVHTLLYPNPTKNAFQIEASQEGTLQLFDIQGKEVKSNMTLVTGTNRFDIAELPTGSYTVLIRYADGSQSTNRIVKY